MQGILPEELQTATETLELPIPMPATQHDSYDKGDGDDLWCEDGSFYDVSDDGSGKTSDLDREWERRHNQFHSILMNYANLHVKKLLHKRVSLAALSSRCLLGRNGALLEVSPDHLKEKMVGELEMRERLQNLYESVHSISTKDALQWFRDDILGSRSEQPHNHLEGNADVATLPDDISRCNQLERFSKELESLLRECPSIQVHPAVDRKTVI